MTARLVRMDAGQSICSEARVGRGGLDEILDGVRFPVDAQWEPWLKLCAGPGDTPTIQRLGSR